MTNKQIQFKKVLIANRGEIAVRIIRSLQEMGIKSVAIYSDADDNSMHRFLANHAVRLAGTKSAGTYLNIPAIIEAAKIAEADAIHPGYGFLSENRDFAEAVTKAGIKFIGPTAEAMGAMGDKIAARSLMQQHSVPVLPGSDGPLQSAEEIKALAAKIGYPMILKAAGGGGGRGMRVVRSDEELQPSFEACQREAISYFGNAAVFCERYLENPRHIEVQIIFDEHGQGVHLYERDCSIQRRHQKLIEEAPSPYLTSEARHRVAEWALQAGKAARYSNAGTVEFICESPEKVYFMEMNTRIQVEHPVTECVTGIDLIKAQINVAMGHPLPWQQDDIKLNGWAVEARINAEDPHKDFQPQIGTISHLWAPGGPFTRFDSHIYAGYRIPSDYDSMIGKLICSGATRAEALERLSRALAELQIEGIITTSDFHQALINHPEFFSGEKIHTGWLAANPDLLDDKNKIENSDEGFQLTAAQIMHQHYS